MRPSAGAVLAVPRGKLAHVVGVSLGLPFGVLSAPVGEVVEEAADFGLRPVEAAYKEVAGMTDAPAAEIGDMVVVLLELRHPPAQRAAFIRPPRIKTLFAVL